VGVLCTTVVEDMDDGAKGCVYLMVAWGLG